ncbi:AAA family ATPase [Tissierella sp.]|uniref:ATP-binding protein n=1 Tax=Tissierella sp. TaxID=41274 RepID=UPI00285B1F57|nr:AAA family ATPase [Tissierella sp.]MDR7855130.1 AAA family ATPase [Tissierella sp.]
MIIKKYICKRFAGIKDKDIDFQDGLNVILGSNEAGKSTLVEGIHSVLFKSSKLGFKSNEDKEFRSKFMPIPAGDSIDGELIISHVDGDYTLSKEWGTESSSKLIMPSLDILKNEESIQEVLKDVLMFGEGTYSSIFFSKQIYIKEAIEKIIGNREATSEVSSLLRRAIMELDGVSLDDLGKKIDDEIDNLYKRWDIEKNYPENNKGISNPYKVGIGEVLESFYKKETIRLAMDEANEAEKQYNDICKQMKETESGIAGLKIKKESMEKLENDVIQRSILEPEIRQFDNELTTLSKINQEWPRNEEQLKHLEADLITLNNDYERLEKEKEQAKILVEKNALESSLAKVDSLNNQLIEIDKQIASITNVTKEDILDLDSNYNNMLTREAMLKAGVIIGQLNYYKGKSDLVVTKDLEEPIIVKPGETFRANGYIKLECEDLLEIELKSGDLDFKEIRLQYEEYKKNFQDILTRLGVKSIEEAKLNKERLDELKRSKDTYTNKINELLDGNSYESLKEKLASFGDLSQVRSLDIIEFEIKDIDKKKIEAISNKKVLEANILKYSHEYVDLDGLFNKIVDLKMSQKEIRNQLDKLVPLPAEYESAEDFREILAETRIDYESSQESLAKLKEVYYEKERNLPKLSYEELSNDYKAEESLFKKKLEKGQRLLKIKESFESTRLLMDEASFTPVIELFSNYIALLTNGNYKAREIDNEFNVKLEKGNQTIMPLNLLSSGTYDSVALALRLAILEYILGDTKGFLILDDCLVDLDPYRKETAVNLINKFSEKHQVIFTTCSPDTAQLLGGYVIEM